MTCGWKRDHQPRHTSWKGRQAPHVFGHRGTHLRCDRHVATVGSSPPRTLSNLFPSERLGWRLASGDGRAFPCVAGKSTQFRGHGDGLLSASIRLHGELHAGGEAVHPSFLETTDARVLIRRHLKEHRGSRPRLGKGLLQEEGCARSRRKGQTGSMLQSAQQSSVDIP